MPTALSDYAEALLAAATRAGADAADALVTEGQSVSIAVRAGVLEQAERAETVDLGLRVLIGRRQASVSASDTRPETIAALAERAVAMAREAPEDPHCGLAEPGQLAEARDAAGLDLEDPAPAPEPATLEAAARAAEAAARAVPGITQMDVTEASWARSRVYLAATNGFQGGYGRTRHTLGAVAISGSGLEMERDYAVETRLHGADMPPPETVGRLAGERAAARAGATKPPSGVFPVVYDERVAAGLIGHLLQAINGMMIARGSSWLRDAMDTPILPAGIDLIEEPLRVRGPASRRFDAEGLATDTRAIVTDGVLRRWVLDLASARKLGLESTANAQRSAGDPPRPGIGNITLSAGDRDRAALLAEMGTGLLVTSLMGASINPNTGDYSRGAAGFWVERGEIVRPVNECTLAGNLREMLKTIRPANDARPHAAQRVPSLLVEGLTLAGR